ncbi:DDT domain-containing protein DDR4 [Quillaja saponaria]|uniref:DDT domain-containing protein DDR4 n=1 Tax=Quillaja saponaria TaxID=32244 RepID=A0AAD7LXH6_QUISA|nr:DDT domain-containing protein DDR4 [Quillaja saponaria]
MVGGHRRQATAISEAASEGMPTIIDLSGEDQEAIEVEKPLQSEVLKLRKRWELASVLNFLDVFSPIIGKDLKLSAEDIEMGLVKPNGSIASASHYAFEGSLFLLWYKSNFLEFVIQENYLSMLMLFVDCIHSLGIPPPVSKTLDGSDAWVTALCKKLVIWWPWVAEGEIPLKAFKGEEISRYKELDPTNRLLLLKALCEIRADQNDAVSYINDALKEGARISCFRKDIIGGDGNGTTYWYDGNAIGHRLYRELITLEPRTKVKGKGCLPFPTINFKWETLATNLEEFHKTMDEFSSSKLAAEVTTGKALETDAIPALEKLRQKKERELKRKQRQERLLDDFKNTLRAGITRSCRTRRPINYTFDDYDRAIKEAIQVTNMGKTTDEQRQGMHTESERRNKTSSQSNSDRDIEDKSDASGNEDDDNSGRMDEDDVHNNLGSSEKNVNHADVFPPKQMECKSRKQSREERRSRRLPGASSHPDLETRNLDTKNTLRHRPTHNSSLDSVVVPDSDDGSS